MGREQELIDLHTLLQGENAVAMAAISGMGGIGKTELAVQYAWTHLAQKTYPGGVVWLNAREDIATQIVLFARSLLMPQPPDDFELAAKVAFYWRNWQEAKTLVILDDVQNYGAIRPLLPVDPHFKILLTTRSRLQSPLRDFAIKVLSEAKAIELLRALVERDRPDLGGFQNLGGLETAKQVCEWLGYLPLGIELVGRYLALKRDLSLESMLARLQQESLQQEALVLDEHDPTYTGNAKRGVAAAFELSWQTLDPPAQQLGELLSLFALAPIPWELVEDTIGERNAAQRPKPRGWRRWLTALWRWLRYVWRQPSPVTPQAALTSLPAVENARSSLLRLHLLQRTEDGMVQLHQLLREFFAAKREQRADVDALKQTLCQVMVTVAEQMPISPTRSQIEQFIAVIPHLKEATTTLQPWLTNADVFKPSTRIAQFYDEQAAAYSEALFWYQHCRAITEARLGIDHPAVAISLSNLANLYRTQGRYAEAEPLCLRALAIGEQLGADHPAVAITLNNLAELYRAQGRYAEAEPLRLRCLEIEKQTLGKNHPQFAASLSNLANLYRAQGRYGEAEPLYLRALASGEQQLGADHPAVATRLNNLAGLYESQGRYGEAEPLYLRALAIGEQQLGANHPAVATTLSNLASLYDSQGRYGEAEPLYLRALAISAQQLGADHPDVAIGLNNLATLYHSQGRYGEAEPLYLRALAILLEKLGNDHPNTQTGRRNFVRFLQQVMEAGQTAQLSEHAVTQYVLRQMQEGNGV